jgi:hypothetical protein
MIRSICARVFRYVAVSGMANTIFEAMNVMNLKN